MGEVRVSIHNAIQPEDERLAHLGEVCKMKPLSINTVLIMRVWSINVNALSRKDSLSNSNWRACGRLRIPIERLVAHCHGGLYHTWLNLESVELQSPTPSVDVVCAD